MNIDEWSDGEINDLPDAIKTASHYQSRQYIIDLET